MEFCVEVTDIIDFLGGGVNDKCTDEKVLPVSEGILVVGFEGLDPEEILGIGCIRERPDPHKIILIRGTGDNRRIDRAFKYSAKC